MREESIPVILQAFPSGIAQPGWRAFSQQCAPAFWHLFCMQEKT